MTSKIAISLIAIMGFLFTLSAQAADKPNIILILSDDFGYGDSAPYGGGPGRGMPTPNLERLAHEGMTFFSFYAQPSCTPGRAAVQTGRIPNRSGMTTVAFQGQAGGPPAAEWTLASVLKQADVKKQGTDVTLISYSLMLNKALNAAEQLAGEGINAEVVDLRTLNPLDHDALARSVQKTHRAVVIQEAVEMGGVAAQIVKSLMDSSFDYLDAPIKTVAAGNTVIPFSPPLEDAMLPSEEKIIAAVKSVAS